MESPKTLNIGLDSWIIQDGNYEEFIAGQEMEFALEFHPNNFAKSDIKVFSFKKIKGSLYKIRGQIVFSSKKVQVVDFGVLSYQENPPEKAVKGSWIEAEIYLGVDPFMYSEELKKIEGIPLLNYKFRVAQIHLETTPWLTEIDATGRKSMLRDSTRESYRQVTRTDAWKDDEGNAHYVLECEPLDSKLPALNS